MNVLITITKDKRNIFCGHAFFMNNLLIEHGRSADAVQQKLKQLLADMYEITPDAFHFIVQGYSSSKALNVINRLKKSRKHARTEVWFDSRYFNVD